MSTLSQFAGGGIKSVQRGITSASSGAVVNVTLSPAVDVSKSFITSSQKPGVITSGYANTGAHVSLTSSTNLQISVANSTGSAPVISWEVIEFY